MIMCTVEEKPQASMAFSFAEMSNSPLRSPYTTTMKLMVVKRFNDVEGMGTLYKMLL